MSPFGLKFSQMILHTETSKLMYNWSFLFVVLHKPTLLPSTFKSSVTHLTTSKQLKDNNASGQAVGQLVNLPASGQGSWRTY